MHGSRVQSSARTHTHLQLVNWIKYRSTLEPKFVFLTAKDKSDQLQFEYAYMVCSLLPHLTLGIPWEVLCCDDGSLVMVSCPRFVCMSSLFYCVPSSLFRLVIRVPMVWDKWYPVAVADYLKKTRPWG